MDQAFIFDKSFQQRFTEFEDVLSGHEILPVSRIKKEWSFFVELTVDPNGWQAVWKIPRKTCESLNIPYPNMVLVFVLKVIWDELSAVVKVLAVQDDIHISDKHVVPLNHLWPTKEQDQSVALNLTSTANTLDMVRFFYNHVFMPWDHDEDDTVDWKTQHLETRLRLYYDMKNGTIPLITSERIQSLINDAKRLLQKRKLLESDVEDIEEDDIYTSNKNLDQLMDVHLKMMEIKWEMDMLENPLLRQAMIRKHKELAPINKMKQQNIWVIFEQGLASDYVQFFSQIEKDFPSQMLKICNQLSSALEAANVDDVYILKLGVHFIKTAGVLELGGILKGLSTKEDTIITSDEADTMLHFNGEHVVLENLTVEVLSAQCGMIIRGGLVTLRNCVFRGDGKSCIQQGIIVLGGAHLELIDCDVNNFSTAIVGNSASIITIKNTNIFACNVGLKVFDGCTVKAAKVTIRNCRDYGICVETENLQHDETKVGDFDSLNIVPKMQMESITGDNNMKGNAVINQKQKLEPIEHLFENPDLDPTFCIQSDEEMQVSFLENTVMESSPCAGSK